MSTRSRLGAVLALAMALPAAAGLPATPAATLPVTLAGLRDVKLLDAGSFVVTGLPPFAREETFEFLRRPDGGVTLLSATTMSNGALRVQARYDYDAGWRAVAGSGLGIYQDEPVQVSLQAVPGAVAIRVRGPKTSLDRTIACPAGCDLDMAPSGSPMYVMTRRYDRAKGGVQVFQWAAQDLTQALTSPPNQRTELRYRGDLPISRADGSTVTLRDYEMIERIPTSDGGLFVMEFDLWTDDADRPMGYRINRTGGKASTAGIVGFRKGYEDVRDRLAGPPR
ncbi:MAG: hypothetical protein J0M16_12185 [Gammaproteobacteria bacterium]|nr:hypothetical protein [Gammaproteobacteria bacterium]